MSRISEVIKGKNKLERERKARRRNELNNLKSKTAYRARLIEQLKDIDKMLDDPSIESVTIVIKKNLIDKFSEALYSGGELQAYNIEQVEGEPLKFKISRKFITL